MGDRELLIMNSATKGQNHGGVSLAWKEVNVYASVVAEQPVKRKSCLQRLKIFSSEKKTFKRILDNVSGCISSGTLMGIMGSSGAGKSTLMTTLAHRRPQGTIVHGDIVVNGYPVGAFMNKLSGFVYQDDIFVGTLTVREHLSFMIQLKLRQRLSREEVNARIYEVLTRAVLNRNVLNRKIGEDSDFKKVLSGGEKKRLSIATELISDPLILFCDEPTTGLDSYNALQVMTTMKNLASAGTIIICTIHQPSQAIFDQLDQVRDWLYFVRALNNCICPFRSCSWLRAGSLSRARPRRQSISSRTSEWRRLPTRILLVISCLRYLATARDPPSGLVISLLSHRRRLRETAISVRP